MDSERREVAGLVQDFRVVSQRTVVTFRARKTVPLIVWRVSSRWALNPVLSPGLRAAVAWRAVIGCFLGLVHASVADESWRNLSIVAIVFSCKCWEGHVFAIGNDWETLVFFRSRSELVGWASFGPHVIIHALIVGTTGRTDSIVNCGYLTYLEVAPGRPSCGVVGISHSGRNWVAVQRALT